MRVRYLRPADYARIKELHAASGFAYELPRLDSPEFLPTLAVCDERDRAVMAVSARRTCELYLFGDASWATPAFRCHALRLLHAAVEQQLRAEHIAEAMVFLPPEVEKSFSRRLMRSFGWVQPIWKCLTRKVN